MGRDKQYILHCSKKNQIMSQNDQWRLHFSQNTPLFPAVSFCLIVIGDEKDVEPRQMFEFFKSLSLFFSLSLSLCPCDLIT